MENFYDNIETYLLGELSGDAFTRFEQAMQNDPKLYKAVADQRAVMGHLDNIRLKAKVKKATNVGASGSEQNTTSLNITRIAVTIAASLIMIVAAVWFFSSDKPDFSEATAETNTPKPVQPADNETIATTPKVDTDKTVAHPERNVKSNQKSAMIALAKQHALEPESTFIRGMTDKGGQRNSVLVEATSAFEQKKYSAVNDLLHLESAVSDNETSRYLRAYARFELGLYIGAIHDFEALINSFQYRHEARWGVMLCQLALDKMDLARKTLTILAADPDYPYQAKAAVLLKELQSK